jgi:hypothetical protein
MVAMVVLGRGGPTSISVITVLDGRLCAASGSSGLLGEWTGSEWIVTSYSNEISTPLGWRWGIGCVGDFVGGDRS